MRNQKRKPTELDRSTADLLQWRRRRLQRAGFDERLAERIAGNRRFDLHALLELIDRGCPPALAARIVAPLDDPPQPPMDPQPERRR